MPLSKTEFKALSKAIVKLDLSVKQLIEYIQEHYVEANVMENSHSNLRGKSHVHVIKRDPDKDLDSTRKSERKRGVKVRTENESLEGQKTRPM